MVNSLTERRQWTGQCRKKMIRFDNGTREHRFLASKKRALPQRRIAFI